VGRNRLLYSRADEYADHNADGDTYPDADNSTGDEYPDKHTDSDAHTHADANADKYADADTDEHADVHADMGPLDSHLYSDRDADFHADSHEDSDTATYRDPHVSNHSARDRDSEGDAGAYRGCPHE